MAASTVSRLATAAVVAGILATTTHARQENEVPPLDEVIVTVTPIGNGTGLSRRKIPYNVQSAISKDIEEMQSLDLADFLNRTMQSISINEVQNNPLQPDVSYRGFTTSPLLGLAQGLAVYQNGVRINEPLGDTVNWDLLPETAVHSMQLIGGANPMFGLNTLGGALSVRMKDGFNSPGTSIDLLAGSFGRRTASVESGAGSETFAWYGNASYFEEDGWRDQSPSRATNLYGSLGWKRGDSSLNLNGQYGRSDLTGNGPVPLELLQTDREAVFTTPDITENDMVMLSVDGAHHFTADRVLSANVFYRRNETDSFNGDASDFSVCRLGADDALLEGLEDDDLEGIDLDEDDVCAGQFTAAAELEDFLNDTAEALGENAGFNLEDLTDELSGSGVLADSAINNRSRRVQRSYGFDVQLAAAPDLFARENRLVVGAAWYRGESAFDSVLELANLDPTTRSTAGRGTGTFVDAAATSIDTETDNSSIYLTDTIDLSERLTLTLSGRFNHTRVELADRSGERPELNGRHQFNRLNPAVGLTWQWNRDLNVFGSYSESSRAPTPVELACNEQVFELAVANAIANGEDPNDIEFECRLPNAFLADPPLEQVVAKSFEFGIRWSFESLDGHAGVFRTTSHDDIVFQTTGRNTGLFANVDESRRQGLETGLSGYHEDLDWFAAYSYIEATFQAPFEALSPNHPFADEETGTISVRPGDRIPGVPAHQLKLGARYPFGERLSAGVDLLFNAGQYVRGDESNRLEKTREYAIVNLRVRYTLNEHLDLLAAVNNLLDEEYETFGLIGEKPSEVDVPAFSGFTNPRFLGPGAPRALYVGVKVAL